MLNIQDADYVVKDDTLSRNRRARAYSRRVARKRALRALEIAVDVVALVAAITLIVYVWANF